MSVCNNLRQYGIPYLADDACTPCDPRAPSSRRDLRQLRRHLPRRARPDATRASAPSAPARRPSTPSATARSSSSAPASPSRRSTSPKLFGRVQTLEDDDPPARRPSWPQIQAYMPRPTRVPREALAEDGQARRRRRRAGWRTTTSHGQRHPVLDLHGGVLRRRALHGDEHDEQQPPALGLRDRHRRARGHVRPGARLGQAQRPRRLEQQLRRRPRQGRRLPLLQPAQGLLRRWRRDRPAVMDYQEIIAGTRGQGEHLRHDRRPHQGRRRSPTAASPPTTSPARSAPTSARASSPTTRSRPSAATA